MLAVSASKSNDDEEIASIKRRNVIKLTAEMLTLTFVLQCGYNDIYEDIIASKFVHEADEVYATYAAPCRNLTRLFAVFAKV